MAEMDLAAAHCVRRALNESKTAEHGVTHKASFTFLKPAYMGDTLDLVAELQKTHNKSLVVKVIATRTHKGRDTEKIAEGDFVFISIGYVGNLLGHPEYLPYINHGL